MDICPKVSERLRVLLTEMDTRRALRDQEAGKASAVRAAAARVRGEIAVMDAKLDRLSSTRIPVKADRLAQLIAGEPVAQLQEETVACLAAETQQINVLRVQSKEDLAALEAHLAELNASVTSIDADLARREGVIYSELAEAIVEKYKQNAIEFIAENVPYIYSAVNRVRAVTGQEPEWSKQVLRVNSLMIYWQATEITQESPAHEPRHETVQVWPRNERTLLSGEQVISDAIIDDLIARIRHPGAPKQVNAI